MFHKPKSQFQYLINKGVTPNLILFHALKSHRKFLFLLIIWIIINSLRYNIQSQQKKKEKKNRYSIAQN